MPRPPFVSSTPRTRFGALTERLLPASDEQLEAIEQWFIARGLPHFDERGAPAAEIWSRAIPLLALFYLGAAFNALDLANWTWQRNVLVGVGALVLVVAVWMVANVARGQPWASLPRRVGPVELAALLLVPMLPAALVGQWGDVVETLLLGVAILTLVWLAASYGALQLLRWAWVTTRGQLVTFANMLLRALPLLLLFTTFLFINAEVWQVAGTLAGIPYWIVVGTFFLLGAAFLLTRTPPLLRRLNHFDSAAAVCTQIDSGAAVPAVARTLAAALLPDPAADVNQPLTRRQRFNSTLVAVFPQALQITLVAASITVFFIRFGFVAIPVDTVAAWTGADVHELVAVQLGGRRLSLNEPLLRVAGFLGAFTGMYFTVVLATDGAYREEFADDVGPALRTAMAVRVPYRLALGTTT